MCEDKTADLINAKKVCNGNPLDIAYYYEISCQVFDAFKQAGLNPKQLLELQKLLPIYYPWNELYYIFRNNYNRRFSYFPMGIIMCRNTRDVQRSVLFVKKYNLKFSIRSGAHCYLPFSLSTGIVIDLSRIDQFKVVCNERSKKCETKIRSNKHIIIGPGARLGVVINELSTFNLSLPTGSCKNTAVGGLSLGGGISPLLMRLGGLTLDHIEEVKIVTADGQLLTVNNSEHSDLFFAIRGAGGGNYGIITEFIFNPCKFFGAFVFDISYPHKQLQEILGLWQDFAPFTDRRLSSEIDLLSSKFYDTPVHFKGQFEGTYDELIELISKFLKLADKKNIDIQFAKTFADAGIFWGTTFQTYYESNSIFWYNKMSRKALDTYADFMTKAGQYSSVEFNAMRGRVSDFKSTETSFPHRKALFWSQQQGKALDPALLPSEQIWVNNLYNSISKFAEKKLNVVPSYANAVQHNLTRNFKYLPAYYGKNVDKLIEIKRKYDPTNFFKFEQSIPLK